MTVGRLSGLFCWEALAGSLKNLLHCCWLGGTYGTSSNFFLNERFHFEWTVIKSAHFSIYYKYPLLYYYLFLTYSIITTFMAQKIMWDYYYYFRGTTCNECNESYASLCELSGRHFWQICVCKFILSGIVELWAEVTQFNLDFLLSLSHFHLFQRTRRRRIWFRHWWTGATTPTPSRHGRNLNRSSR